MVGIAALAVLVAAVLLALGDDARPPIGSAGVGAGRFPVAMVAGLESDGSGFATLTRLLQAQGTPVLDFDPARAGTQPFTWQPHSGDHLGDIATRDLQPALHAALAAAGLAPDATIDIVAHSAGGLFVRHLIEHPGGAVEPGWAAQVDDLVLLAVPNGGTTFGSTLATMGMGSDNPFAGVGADIHPGSAFLLSFARSEPPGEVYTAIGGDPWFLRFLRTSAGSPLHARGFDGAAPADSPWLAGAAFATYGETHGALVRSATVTRFVAATLAATAATAATAPTAAASPTQATP